MPRVLIIRPHGVASKGWNCMVILRTESSFCHMTRDVWDLMMEDVYHFFLNGSVLSFYINERERACFVVSVLEMSMGQCRGGRANKEVLTRKRSREEGPEGGRSVGTARQHKCPGREGALCWEEAGLWPSLHLCPALVLSTLLWSPYHQQAYL